MCRERVRDTPLMYQGLSVGSSILIRDQQRWLGVTLRALAGLWADLIVDWELGDDGTDGRSVR
jgi:hypothetical protein